MTEYSYKLVKGNWEVDKSPFDDMTLEQRRNIILGIENKLAELPGAIFGNNDHAPLKHSFADGIYVREIFIPKDSFLVGRIHKFEHPNFLMKGSVTVLTEEGGLQKLKAPQHMISPSHTKRVVYTHEDTTWVTVHATDKTNIEEIEKDITLESYNIIESEDLKCLSGQ